MGHTNNNQPYKPLGVQLKKLRENRQESLAEVSGAVEIEPDTLQSIELGTERPGEEILLLLISHFATKDETASKLWNLAGYDQSEIPVYNASNSALGEPNVPNPNLSASNTPIIYTDMVHIMVNNYGVVMNFMQTSVANNQPQAISRIGMSREHAKSVLEILQKTLTLSDQKQIAPLDDTSNKIN